VKILVRGADGFLGRHFVAHLRRGGHTVTRGVHRPRLPGDIALDAGRIFRRPAGCRVWLASRW
jgi:nucleoside-diphosphate-sugar epimerase